MNDQSQIEEMRAALRGDRERAEQARQRTAENVLELGGPPAVVEPVHEQPAEARRGLLSRLLGR